MFSRKYNKMLKRKQHPDDVKGFKISTSTKQYSPFELQDTRYLEHLRDHMKLRETYQGSLLKRNELLESSKRANYQNELDRLMNELYRPNLPHSSIEHMDKRLHELMNLVPLPKETKKKIEDRLEELEKQTFFNYFI